MGLNNCVLLRNEFSRDVGRLPINDFEAIPGFNFRPIHREHVQSNDKHYLLYKNPPYPEQTESHVKTPKLVLSGFL